MIFQKKKIGHSKHQTLSKISKSPIAWVIGFLLLNLSLGFSMSGIYFINSDSKSENRVFKIIFQTIKNILSSDSRSLKKVEYIGIENNKLIVGATSTEETYPLHLFEYTFHPEYTSSDIFNYIYLNGLKNISFTNDIYCFVSCDTYQKPSQLDGKTLSPKTAICYLSFTGHKMVMECGVILETTYSFIFDETTKETIYFNVYEDCFKEVLLNIWSNQ